MTPLTFVTWKWKPRPGYRSTFGPETVNVLRRMIDRHYRKPHRFICVTDDAAGLDPRVEVVPDWKDFSTLPPPCGGHNPSCYRRLRAFHPDIGDTFGPRFVSLDLDVVFTDDVEPVFDRPEDFLIYGDTNPRTYYNGSVILMNAGARPQVWNTFDPVRSPQLAKAAGHFGSDQGWLSYCLGPNEKKWTTEDGVYSFQCHMKRQPQALPSNARVIVMHGHVDPWSRQVRRFQWVQKHYC